MLSHSKTFFPVRRIGVRLNLFRCFGTGLRSALNWDSDSPNELRIRLILDYKEALARLVAFLFHR